LRICFAGTHRAEIGKTETISRFQLFPAFKSRNDESRKQKLVSAFAISAFYPPLIQKPFNFNFNL
jgi:hypothetical protein